MSEVTESFATHTGPLIIPFFDALKEVRNDPEWIALSVVNKTYDLLSRLAPVIQEEGIETEHAAYFVHKRILEYVFAQENPGEPLHQFLAIQEHAGS
jgi:hypothetical protein